MTEIESPTPHRPPSSLEQELARAQARAEELEFELELSRQTVRRLERELRAVDVRLAEVVAQRESAQRRADETGRYIEVLHLSLPWRVLKMVRRLVRRSW